MLAYFAAIEFTSILVLVLQRRREQQRTDTKGLDDAARELLEVNRQERDQMEDEINELRRRNVRQRYIDLYRIYIAIVTT